MRRRLGLLPGAVVTALGVAALALGALMVRPAAAPARLSGGLDVAVPPLPLVDEDGHATSLAAFQGKAVVVAPVATLCGESCPITVGTLLELQRSIVSGGLSGKVQIVTVSVDPWRDTPARLRAYAARFGVSWPLLTGSVTQLTRFWGFFHIGFGRQPQGDPPETDWLTGKPQAFDVWHTDVTFVLDPTGHERAALMGAPVPGHRLPAALARTLSDEGRRDLASPQPGGWTAAEALAKVAALLPGAVPRLGSAGEKISLAAYPGPLIVNFFASWCAPCRTETPLLAGFAAAHPGRRVLGVDVRDPGGLAFVRAMRVGYPVADDRSSTLAGAYGVYALPQTLFLDQSHKVVSRVFGPLTAASLQAYAARL